MGGARKKKVKRGAAGGFGEQRTQYGEAFVEEWYKNNHVEFERKLK